MAIVYVLCEYCGEMRAHCGSWVSYSGWKCLLELPCVYPLAPTFLENVFPSNYLTGITCTDAMSTVYVPVTTCIFHVTVQLVH